MTKIDAHGLGYRELNEDLRRAEGEIEIDGCMGQRFIASGMSGKKIKINGIPGNALGAYLDGSEIEVMGNVQDAVGDTMNFGTIAEARAMPWDTQCAAARYTSATTPDTAPGYT